MQNYMNTNHFMTGFQGMPPSRLGFVCKPDMPPHINILFRARPPLEFVEKPFKGKCRKYEGFVGNSKSLLEMFEKTKPELRPIELTETKRLKSIVEKLEKHKAENKEKIKQWNPKNDPEIQGDPFKTLFVYKLNYNTDEKKLKKDFEIYGPIKRVKIILDKEGKSRGYGFIEYEHKADFKTAYKRAENRRIDNTPVQVDYERGRTEKSWRPRRLGGEKGNIRELPGWLDKELKKIREIYPELGQNFKKQKVNVDSHGDDSESVLKVKARSRSRSRDKSIKPARNEEKKSQVKDELNINEQHCQINIHVVEAENNQIVYEDKILIENSTVKYTEDVNLLGNKMAMEGDNGDLDKEKKKKKEKKDKKHKRDKKDKKHKKDKKDRKDKKDKKEKKDKKTPSELEIGEIE